MNELTLTREWWENAKTNWVTCYDAKVYGNRLAKRYLKLPVKTIFKKLLKDDYENWLNDIIRYDNKYTTDEWWSCRLHSWGMFSECTHRIKNSQPYTCRIDNKPCYSEEYALIEAADLAGLRTRIAELEAERDKLKAARQRLRYFRILRLQ